tara:strand:- start:2569 stop:2721 length:153 start_codon:yes stop_codon:yes gene_type:complete
MLFGKKKEKELHGLNHIKKLKTLSIVKMKLELNGTKMELLMLLLIVLIDT